MHGVIKECSILSWRLSLQLSRSYGAMCHSSCHAPRESCDRKVNWFILHQSAFAWTASHFMLDHGSIENLGLNEYACIYDHASLDSTEYVRLTCAEDQQQKLRYTKDEGPYKEDKRHACKYTCMQGPRISTEGLRTRSTDIYTRPAIGYTLL